MSSEIYFGNQFKPPNKLSMRGYYEFSSEQEYEEYAQYMWLINNNKV